MGTHPLIALGVAGFVALVSLRRGLLSRSGALAAWAVGAITLALGGGRFFAPLLGFFLAVNVVGKLGRRWLSHRLPPDWEPPEAKGGPRDHVQVLANAGVATAMVLLHALAPPDWRPALEGAFLGSICANSADTFASEIGIYSRRGPVVLGTFRPIAHGLSGGVTSLGYVAAAVGALVPAGIAVAAGAPLGAWGMLGAVACGLLGSTVDSLAGAWLQEKRICGACGRTLEKPIHCGAGTRYASGSPLVTNDVVNALGAATGALAGAWLLA